VTGRLTLVAGLDPAQDWQWSPGTSISGHQAWHTATMPLTAAPSRSGIPAGARLKDVVVLVPDRVATFELGVLCEVFGTDRTDIGLPEYDFALARYTPGRVRTTSGFDIVVEHGLDRLASADLVAVPAYETASEHEDSLPDPLVEALQAAYARGAMILSVCSGAFGLGQAGLLDGRRCTTHWRHTDELIRRYPNALVEPDVLYVTDDRVLTSAGTAAGIDLCLHLVREVHGSEVANAIARRMVIPPHRAGGQAQYVDRPLPEPGDGSLRELLTWMIDNVDVELTVDELAGRALMSPRTFARRFRAETGTTPHKWLVGQRILRAQQLLESGDEPIERVAQLSGFGNAATLRHHFAEMKGTTPQAFRRTFRAAG
jgi:transcriptional regulator GlxA family with amidase domain